MTAPNALTGPDSSNLKKLVFGPAAQQLGDAPGLGDAATGIVRQIAVEYLRYRAESRLAQVLVQWSCQLA